MGGAKYEMEMEIHMQIPDFAFYVTKREVAKINWR